MGKAIFRWTALFVLLGWEELQVRCNVARIIVYPLLKLSVLKVWSAVEHLSMSDLRTQILRTRGSGG